jgi:hypothetical protein
LAYSSYISIGPTGLDVRRGTLYVGGQFASTALTIGATKIVEVLCADCDADRSVRANDIVAAVRAAGEDDLAACQITEANEDGIIDEAEIARAIGTLFDACRL